MHIYRTIAKVVPKKFRKKIVALLSFSNLHIKPDKFIGFFILFSVILGVVLGLLTKVIPFWASLLGSIVLVNTTIYMWLVVSVDKKASLVEEALPDALQLMSSNLRAGMTPDKALLLSSRPEFGPLKDEIDIVGRKVTLGNSIGGALMAMANRIKSQRLTRAVELINSGLGSGGSLADLLEKTAEGLREQFLVDKKIKANITMYIIFIFSASAIITPILFGLSSFLVDVLKSSLSQIEIPSSATAAIPIQIGQVEVTGSFLMLFIITFLIANTFMASMILGLIGKGRQRAGIKYFIPMAILAVPLFLLARYLIKSILSGLFAF